MIATNDQDGGLGAKHGLRQGDAQGEERHRGRRYAAKALSECGYSHPIKELEEIAVWLRENYHPKRIWLMRSQKGSGYITDGFPVPSHP